MASMALEPKQFSGLSFFVKTQVLTKCKPPPSSLSFKDQTAIITGSNVGIGLETCRQLLKYGLSHLVMAARNTNQAEKEASKMRIAYPKAAIEVWALDMLSYDSIQQFSQRLKSLHRLDTVILNAAVFNADFKMGTLGHEETFQVNYLSTSLLAIQVLPILKAKKHDNQPGRLTIVSSNVGLTSNFPSRDVSPIIPTFRDQEMYGDAVTRYSVSKMLLLMLTAKLGTCISANDVVVNAVDPGYTGGSSLHRSFSGGMSFVFSFLKGVASRTPEEAAWIYMDATAVKGPDSHGGFVVNWEIYPFNPIMYTVEGKQATERLWNETLKELEFANAEGIIKSMST